MANVFAAFPQVFARTGIEARHIVHVGAHEGQEVPFYRQVGFQKITLIEPIPRLAQKLRTNFPDCEVIEAACADYTGTSQLTVMRRTNLSTLHSPGQLDRVSEYVGVRVDKLSNLVADANVAVIDTQGYELATLRGADLSSLDMLVVETCTIEDRTMAAYLGDVTAYVGEHNFKPFTYWPRDYDWLANWARGVRTKTGAQVRDVVFVK